MGAGTGGTAGDDDGGSLIFGVAGEMVARFSDATGGGAVTTPLPQKKNVVLRMNNPRSPKNGSLPCMMVTFTYGEQQGTPQQNIVYAVSRQEVGREARTER